MAQLPSLGTPMPDMAQLVAPSAQQYELGCGYLPTKPRPGQFSLTDTRKWKSLSQQLRGQNVHKKFVILVVYM